MRAWQDKFEQMRVASLGQPASCLPTSFFWRVSRRKCGVSTGVPSSGKFGRDARRWGRDCARRTRHDPVQLAAAGHVDPSAMRRRADRIRIAERATWSPATWSPATWSSVAFQDGAVLASSEGPLSASMVQFYDRLVAWLLSGGSAAQKRNARAGCSLWTGLPHSSDITRLGTRHG